MTKEQKLARIHNRATAYEVVAVRGDEQILIGYTTQHSRSGLLGMCRKNGERVIARLMLSTDSMLVPGKKASDGFALGDWQVRFSGRTQREAIIEGELPWVGDAAVAA